MIKRFILAFIVGFLLIATPVFSQTTIAVDINKAKLTWQWAQGTGSAADGYNVKCGPTSGAYTKVTIVTPSTAKEVPVLSAITGPGTYFCAVSAFNIFGDSAVSNEVTFNAGSAPLPPTSATITSN